MKTTNEYQPKTGARCHCRRGVERDNCPSCEGTGWQVDFKAIRDRKPLERKTLFAITHINKDGMRQLTFANQGRNHHSTQYAADKALASLLENNSRTRLVEVGICPDTLAVRPVECYGHGDAIGIYFDK